VSSDIIADVVIIFRYRHTSHVTVTYKHARHVIVNVLRPFTETILFRFMMERPAQIKLLYCKTISHSNTLFHAEIGLFQHGTNDEYYVTLTSKRQLQADYHNQPTTAVSLRRRLRTV